MDAKALALGHWIAEARTLKGWSAAELARQASVAANTVSAIENGRNVQPRKLKAVLDAVGIDPLAAAQAREGYDTDIELVRDAIGMWLRDLPPTERAERVRDIIACIARTR